MRIIFCIYLFYFRFFPIDRGKQFIAICISQIFGSNFYKTKKGIWLDILLKSPQDLYLLNFDGNDKLTEIITSLSKKSIFLDIGANIGYYSFVASKHFENTGKIISFEPSFREYIRLLNGIEKNKLTNIIPVNACISDISGELLLNIDNIHTGLNKIFTLENNLYNKTTNRVAVFKLDSILKIFNFGFIDLIKIDVEGAELLVLLGMEECLRKGIVGILYVEITPKYLGEYGHTKEMLYQFMTDCGFVSTINSNDWQYDEIFILKNTIIYS